MAKKYVSRCNVMMGGAKLEHMKNFKALESTYRNEVDLMSGAGTVDVAQKYKFSIDYAVPVVGARLDWSGIEDSTVVVEYEGGKRVTYSAVDCLSTGEVTTDGQGEAVITITFIAGSRDEG